MKLVSRPFMISLHPTPLKQRKPAHFLHVSNHSSNTVTSKAILNIIEILKCMNLSNNLNQAVNIQKLILKV